MYCFDDDRFRRIDTTSAHGAPRHRLHWHTVFIGLLAAAISAATDVGVLPSAAYPAPYAGGDPVPRALPAAAAAAAVPASRVSSSDIATCTRLCGFPLRGSYSSPTSPLCRDVAM